MPFIQNCANAYHPLPQYPSGFIVRLYVFRNNSLILFPKKRGEKPTKNQLISTRHSGNEVLKFEVHNGLWFILDSVFFFFPQYQSYSDEIHVKAKLTFQSITLSPLFRSRSQLNLSRMELGPPTKELSPTGCLSVLKVGKSMNVINN